MRRRVPEGPSRASLHDAADFFLASMPGSANAADNDAWDAWGAAVAAFEEANGFGLHPLLTPAMDKVPFDIETEAGS